MTDQEKANFSPIHNGIVAMLDLIEKVHGREAAEELLARIQETFKTGVRPEINLAKILATTTTVDGDEMSYEAFIEKGGYSLKEYHILFEQMGVMTKPLAFGIVPPDAISPGYRLNFLLSDGNQLELGLSQLIRYSYNPNPAYGKDAPFIFCISPNFRMTSLQYHNLIANLQKFGATSLAQALSHMNPWPRNKINDDVPTDKLIPLTDEERRTLQPIANMRFSYGQPDEAVLRITAVGSGYVFHTPTQSVEISARNIDVMFMTEPKPASGYWLLAASITARHGGVSLHDVMSLTEDDPRRSRYLPLIDVFIAEVIADHHRTKQ